MTSKVTKKGELIRNTILSLFGKQTSLSFAEIYKGSKGLNLSESAIRKHVCNLVEQHCLNLKKNESKRVSYSLCDSFSKSFTYDLNVLDPDNGDEMAIWIKDIDPLLTIQNKGCIDILETAFCEIFNNAMSHSNGSSVRVYLNFNALQTKIIIQDNGIGIFKKIKDCLKLPDERQSLLELSKGKMTTDAKDHSGEGIFFVSKACNFFAIVSGDLVFSHNEQMAIDLLEQQKISLDHGTLVYMLVNNNTSRNMKKVYDKFASPEGGFTKTLVPVKLLRYKNEGIVSRSQAKRLMARVDRFKNVCLDFEGIDQIGQGFADEIFRVYASTHPDVQITTLNTNTDINNMIKHVTA
ncbi:MAG: DUF4325 domain-containing protein [Succinatimonas sp.]|nr:DUF4325 domain-containing protein [Succinatimonas sp.]